MSEKLLSDSESSEDEMMARLREAADTTLISDNMFATSTTDRSFSSSLITWIDYITDESQKNAKPTVGTANASRSERYLDDTADHYTDLNIPQSMQNFLYNKLSENISSSIEFINIVCAEGDRQRSQSGTENVHKSAVKLLKDTEPIIRIDNEAPSAAKQTKPSIIRRQIESDGITYKEKLKAAVLNGESILLGHEVCKWKSRKVRTQKVFNYREKSNKLYSSDPLNEFSAKRKKNNWTESKIAKWKSLK